MKIDLPSRLFILILCLSVVAVILATGVKFLLLKDYNFLVEASCDPRSEKCFFRDCSNLDDCPPNGLENYKIFEVSAADFQKCSDESCAVECSNAVAKCNEIKCGDSEADECNAEEGAPLSAAEATEETNNQELVTDNE